MSTTVTERAGRKWKTVKSGDTGAQIESLTRVFVVHDADAAYLYAGGAEPTGITGVPTIGTAHPLDENLVVDSVDFDEGSGGDKNTIVASVNYTRKKEEGESTEGEDNFAVDEWGWDAGTEQVELTSTRDATPLPVVNSAGDPFDSVPQVTSYTPTFTKVMKFKTRQSVMGNNCKVNSAQVTIGSMTCDAGTLLCAVSEKRIFGDANWKYQYTVNLKYRSNKVLVKNSTAVTPVEIGWDVAICDTGMRQIDPTDNTKRVLITRRDEETHKLMTVSTPAPLDGSGYAVSPTDPNKLYNLRFTAYERTTFPTWFYSEPNAQEPEEAEAATA